MISDAFSKVKGKYPETVYTSFGEHDQPYFLFSETICGGNMKLAYYPVSWSGIIESWCNESKYFQKKERTSSDKNIATNYYKRTTCVLENTHIV